jgi:hypothetical protein
MYVSGSSSETQSQPTEINQTSDWSLYRPNTDMHWQFGPSKIRPGVCNINSNSPTTLVETHHVDGYFRAMNSLSMLCAYVEKKDNW